MSQFPAVAYHEGGSHVVVVNAEAAAKLGKGYSEKPCAATHRALRKASGAAKTDLQPGQYPKEAESY